MIGRERIRKKHLNQAGWKVLDQGKKEDQKGFYLLLRDPGGQQVRVDAATRPRAFEHAQEMQIQKSRVRAA